MKDDQIKQFRDATLEEDNIRYSRKNLFLTLYAIQLLNLLL